MRPCSKYVFERLEGTCSRFVLTKHEGINIPNFPATWKRTENKGKQYIVFMETQREQKKGRRYSHTISLENNRNVTGFNFYKTNPLQTYGDDKWLSRNDAVMIKFSEDNKTITMLFYKDMAKKACALYEKWTAGILPETVDDRAFILNKGIKKTGCTAIQPD